jgi:hypothetical protein
MTTTCSQARLARIEPVNRQSLAPGRQEMRRLAETLEVRYNPKGSQGSNGAIGTAWLWISQVKGGFWYVLRS